MLLGACWRRLFPWFSAFARLLVVLSGGAILRVIPFSGLGRIGLLVAGGLRTGRRLCLLPLFLSRAGGGGLLGKFSLLLSELARLSGGVFRAGGRRCRLLRAVRAGSFGLIPGGGLGILAGELFELLLFLFVAACQFVL